MKINAFLISTSLMLCSLTGMSQETARGNAEQSPAKHKQDIKAIKSMCGCYEVKFNFAETFSYPKDSLTYKPSQTKHETALEWVELLEDQPNKIVLQHLLIVGKTEKDIIKHWRQDWLYENTELYSFFKDRTWKYNKLSPKDVKGQWTQKVYMVDDSPRYEGSATWSYVDGKTSWTNTTDAPLPRREYTKRNDYNVLKRRNIHAITSTGWTHEQDNEKLIRDDKGNDVLLAEEKGLDIYTKVDDSKCQIAKSYWAKNKVVWEKIRTKWDTVLAKDATVNLQKTVDGKPLYSHLFELKADATQSDVDKIIDSFIVK